MYSQMVIFFTHRQTNDSDVSASQIPLFLLFYCVSVIVRQAVTDSQSAASSSGKCSSGERLMCMRQSYTRSEH